MVSSGLLQEPHGVTTQKTPFFMVLNVCQNLALHNKQNRIIIREKLRKVHKANAFEHMENFPTEFSRDVPLVLLKLEVDDRCMGKSSR
jgi:hypothetical protein